MEQNCAHVLKDWQKKIKTELETKDNLIQDMEKYFGPLFEKLLSGFLIRIISEDKNNYAVAESNLRKEIEMLKKVKF